MESYLKSIFRLAKRIQKLKRTFKGSKEDPLFCLGASSVIFLVFVSLASGPIADSLYNKGDFSIASLSNALKEPAEEEIFAGLAKKTWSESPEFLLLGDSSLKAVSPPSTFSPQALGALVGGYEFSDTKRIITEYAVEPGDSLSAIAGKFDISLNTLLWANNLNSGSLIQPGQKLTILPISGVVHHVKTGDTISEIAERYKGKSSEIIAFNNLSGEGDIFVGDIVIVPGGQEPKISYQYAPLTAPLADSYFICPVSSPCRITQGLHWYNAIDFSNGKCGEVIYAAAAGQILKVKLTSSTSKYALNGYGNHITILHSNGVVTYYGHISTALVSAGDNVSQGQPIALMGGKPGTPGAGNSTGCHVHFGVSGSRNPFSK